MADEIIIGFLIAAQIVAVIYLISDLDNDNTRIDRSLEIILVIILIITIFYSFSVWLN